MGTDAWIEADPIPCPICGLEACEEHLSQPSRRRPDTAPALRFVPADTVITEPRPAEIIEGVAWANALSVLVSESGAGKTFLLLDLSAAVSSDTTWHGRRVRHGSIAYLSYEGDALGPRLRALQEHGGHRLEHLYLLRATDPLSPRVSRDGEEPSIGELHVLAAVSELAADLRTRNRPPITLIVIDTVRASLAGSEDSSEQVSAYLRVVRRLMTTVPGAAAILAHHAGWQDGETQKKRERGSSAWRGNCDATLYLEAGDYDPERGEAALTLRALKVRDTERPAPLHLLRRRIEVAEMAAPGDTRGGPVTSCVIDHDRRTREDRAAAEQATVRAADLRVLRAIAERPLMATSQDRIRQMLGVRKGEVGEAIARLLSQGWLLLPATQRQPYGVTDAGRLALTGGNCE